MAPLCPLWRTNRWSRLPRVRRQILSPPNIVKSGTTGSQTTTFPVQAYSIGATVLCGRGNSTVCNLLANLCVTLNYEVTAMPYALYQRIKQSTSCDASRCEAVDGFPWLSYTRRNAEVLSSAATQIRTSASQELQFVVSAFDLYGNWLRYQSLASQLNPCFLVNTELQSFFATGDKRATSCHVIRHWFLRAHSTLFCEVYLRHPSNTSRLLPVPLLADYSNYSFGQATFHNSWLYRSSAAAFNGVLAEGGF
ncbi:Meckelin (Transmembrane protein 67), putative [Leishmania guyanensis]